jgi:hypothetical protein
LVQEEQNRLYRSTLLHISAEENMLTGALRNPVLLAFEAHQPAYDEAEFQQMVRRGTAAWSDVRNATEWVEGLCGGRACCQPRPSSSPTGSTHVPCAQMTNVD